ncbi:uncharacterized protein LOC100680390 [Nasonia vitripennis]|uniref:Uncharacterized protein n=1 Tax=Nasonia vitripennis TaxID=7425 RepID=A0A7M7QWT0_NASVI|nr:uncharacterized protein LOC100680390 [Nasonia vitripennis]XP_008208704.1 uncharacterized protein LOC100680390 [Nasonia vitripennis]XP_008208705.1 uncharacterized protein LOC100680390 [Nasonia vitripennis]XP_008208706.1 uncharacterized protein LOC100680390 [Nasonia vitripennis]XP_032455842.1 uncharacterized protein LOC100680390 [Nasonia vitripennis]XP_032455843.1 uncharacterized protein LOC100680390 [Nasonia vitripennis]XP_032455844.1 uncharacterized protein LOC100680390 [Nasonia vitripenni
MSALKTVFLLLVCVTIALGFHIDSRAKRATTNSTNTSSDSVSTTSSDSISSPLYAGNAASAMQNAASTIGSGAKGVASRVQNAFNSTYQEEKDSVSDSWNNVKELIHQNVETGANLTKTAFDLGTIFPNFGKNLIIGN